jgi:hypothetical protein
VDLLALVQAVELGREIEVKGRQGLKAKLALVEGAGPLKVVDDYGHVLDLEHIWH